MTDFFYSIKIRLAVFVAISLFGILIALGFSLFELYSDVTRTAVSIISKPVLEKAAALFAGENGERFAQLAQTLDANDEFYDDMHRQLADILRASGHKDNVNTAFIRMLLYR
jgi:hypothetical protein